MKARCIKADSLGWLEVGEVYSIREFPAAFIAYDANGNIVQGVMREEFDEHFMIV